MTREKSIGFVQGFTVADFYFVTAVLKIIFQLFCHWNRQSSVLLQVVEFADFLFYV